MVNPSGRSRRGRASMVRLRAVWSAVVVVACWVVALVSLPAFALGAGSSFGASSSGASMSSAGAVLGAAAGEGSSGAGLSLRGTPFASYEHSSAGTRRALGNAARQAWLGSSQAIAARERSHMEFAHLDAARAAQVAREAFPAVVLDSVGGPPSLPAGQRIVRFLGTKAAQLELPHGKRAIVESLGPMAVEASGGHEAPVDLSLTEAGSGDGGLFESVRPAVGVLIGRHASEGAMLPEAGVSLTPVNAQGKALGGSEGQIDGASVIYANTQTDTDAVVKPTIGGVEASAILRSVDSPSELYFRVGLPAGARLVQTRAGAGPVSVVVGGRTVALVRPPSATDAAGTGVPVSMRVEGDLLALSVSSHEGSYQWPIVVDPELAKAEDTDIGPEECHKANEAERRSSNWCVYAHGDFNKTGWSEHAVELSNGGSLTAGEYAVAAYLTQGESKIYELEAYTVGYTTKGVMKIEFARKRNAAETEAEQVEKGEVETSFDVATNKYKEFSNARYCVKAEASGECAVSAGSAGNLAAFKLEATESGGGADDLDAALEYPKVYITQEKGPEVSFNTSEAELEVEKGVKRLNAMDGQHDTGGREPWLGPYSNTAVEVKAKDPGIGVAWAQVSAGGFREEEPIYLDHKCNGVQCPKEYHSDFTYNPAMAEGEYDVDWDAADLAGRACEGSSCYGLEGETAQLIKVDAKAPEDLEVSGWPARREISAAPHTLTVEATDGAPKEGHSSGIKSIAVSVEGGPATPVSNLSCSDQLCTLGPTTGKGAYTLDAEDLSEGVHRLTVIATDNADNVAAREFTFDVRHGTPVPVGPGTVDPTTGQFKLSAADVSLAGAGSVSRVYESRDTTAGAGGPLGPQWALGLGGGEGLTVLSTGSVVLSSSAGATTTFTRNEEGKFESPLGDGNVKVEAKEKETGKGIGEYLLIDAKAGTTTTFVQPSGLGSTTPLYANQFGTEGAQLDQPISDAVDANGNVWVTSYGNDRIEKFSSTGTLIGAYGSQGSGAGQFSQPWGIAVNKSTGNVYVTDQGNYRVDEYSSSGVFIGAFGWGVKNGEAGLQTCTSECRQGLSGTGEGQFSVAAGVAVDSSGDVWVVDYGADRIQEFNTEGSKVLQKFGSEGTGKGQFKGALNMAFSGGDVYVTDYGNNRVQEFSTAGKWEGEFGKGGSGNGEFAGPYGIAVDPATGDLYVDDSGNKRVEQFSAAGAFIAKFGSPGYGAGQFAGPTGVAVGSVGGVYVVDNPTDRVDEWMRSTWLPSLTRGPLKNVTAAYAYKPVEEEGTTVIEPTEELAATPAGIACVGAKGEVEVKYLKKGCRALTFKYDTGATGAKGEKESEWGSYTGRLERVSLIANTPGTESMPETPVAEYAYDSKGRLRAEWDPRIESSTACGKPCSVLKTTYGYDGEGHVTALTQAGRQPWAFTYGTVAGDANAGRLLKVTRAHPNASWSEKEVKEKLSELKEPPGNSEAPKLSAAPVMGVQLSVSDGTWSHRPVAYSYQWEDCNSKGEECTRIAGANNQTYRPASSDEGHTVRAQVSATNGDGSVIAVSEAQLVTSGLTVSEYPVGKAEFSEDGPVAAGPDGNVWFRQMHDKEDKLTYIVGKITSSGSITEYELPSGSGYGSIAAGPDGDMWFTESSANKVGKMTTSGVISAEYELPIKDSDPYNITAGPDGNMWFIEGGTKKIGKLTTSGALTEYSLPSSEMEPDDITAGPDGNLWVTESHYNSKGDYYEGAIGRVTTSGVVTEYSLPEGGYPLDITAGPDGNLWFTVPDQQDVDKITTWGAITRYDLGEGPEPRGITSGANGNLWVASESQKGVYQVTTSGVNYAFVSVGGQASHIVAGPDGNIWFASFESDKIGRVLINQGESSAPQPGATIEYNVPLEGWNVPAQLGVNGETSRPEPEKWGQKDDPTEATAIFPPDEPQSWPASDYKRAAIDYMDEEGRTVNTATPHAGEDAIATTEYNAENEVTRTLSAGDRAVAMKEGCKSVAKKECKSAEVAEKLGTETEYNSEGSQVVKTLGPEHEVKLASGEKVQARAVTRDYYSNGGEKEEKEKKEAEEKNKETYSLLTKATEGALVTSGSEAGKERDVRETVTSYSGQEDLGWTLRKPTSVTREPGTLKLTSTTVYERESGNVLETRAPKGSVSGTPAPPVFAAQWGSYGSGSGQFEAVYGVAVDPKSGDVYTVDHELDRVGKFSSMGAFLGWVGSAGSGEGQLKGPESVAVSSSGNVYVGDAGNHRVEEFSSEGKYVRAFGKEGTGEGQFGSAIYGLAFDGGGRLWVTDGANHRVERFSETGTFEKQVGEHGTGERQFEEPRGIAVSGNDVYVVDTVNDDMVELNLEGGFVRRIGGYGMEAGQLREPWGVAVDAEGDLFVADRWPDKLEEFNSTGMFVAWVGSSGTGQGQFEDPDGVAMSASGQLYVADQGNGRVDEWELVPGTPVYTAQFGSKGSENGQFSNPRGVAMAKNGNVYVLDTSNSRVEEFSPAGAYLNKFGASGSTKEHVSIPFGMAVDSKGDVWIADTGNDRIDEFNEKREWVQAFGWGVDSGEAKLEVCTTSCKAGIAGSGAGQFKEPKAIAVNASGDVYVADVANNRIEEFTEKGEFVAAFGFEVNESGKEEYEICTSKCKAGTAGAGNGQFKEPRGVAIAPNGDLWVADTGDLRVEEFGAKNEYLTKFGSSGSGHGQFKEPKGIAIDASGNVWVADGVNDDVQELTPSGTFLAEFGDKGTGNGQFEEPWGIAFSSSGSLYVADIKNSRVEEWTEAPSAGSEGAHDAQTIYYSAGANTEYSECGGRPEWADLVCRTQPAAQPGISASPSLAVTVVSAYNMWDEAEKAAERLTRRNAEGKEETVTREKIETYDPAGRAVTSEEKAQNEKEEPVDTKLPKVTNEYNSETGAVEKQSAEIGGKTKTLTSRDNTLGQQVEYDDAEGNVAKYTYEEGGDGRLEEVSEGKGEEAKSTQTFSYNATTGLMEKLIATDANMTSAQGTFTATYDVEGRMTGEVYPNGMCADTTFNAIGEATTIEYLEPKTCSEGKPTVWFSDSIVPSIHGETLEQNSTLAKEKYAYDNAGRLLEAQETPAGKGCVSRLYGYEEESNRVSETTRESATETCATEGGVVQGHFYDSANRLIDPGVEYEVFGDITKMPALDAEHEIVSTYYLDNQVATQEQSKQLLKYTYDPAGRTMETVIENTETKAKKTVINHYAGSGNALRWTSEGSEKWTRDIAGVDGALDAVQEAGKAPVLQLHDLQGNIVGTVGDSESEAKLATTYNSTEFGVPNEGKAPPKYGWLGAEGVSSEPSQGTGTSTQSGASYVPQVARNLQTAPVIPPGAFPNGQGTGSQYDSEIPGWYIALSNEESGNTLAEFTAKQEAEREEREEKEREREEKEKEEKEGSGSGSGSGSGGGSGGGGGGEGGSGGEGGGGGSGGGGGGDEGGGGHKETPVQQCEREGYAHEWCEENYGSKMPPSEAETGNSVEECEKAGLGDHTACEELYGSSASDRMGGAKLAHLSSSRSSGQLAGESDAGGLRSQRQYGGLVVKPDETPPGHWVRAFR